MFVFLALFQDQETSSVFTLPSYFLPTFLIILILGFILSISTVALGVSRVIKIGKSYLWLLLTSVCLFLYFLQWLVMGYAKLKGYETTTWITLSFLNFFSCLAVVFVLIGLSKTKENI